MKKAVMCIVGTSEKVELVVNRLHRAGFTTNDISVLFPDKTGTRDFAHEHSTKAPEGAIGGAGMGGVVGGTLGLLAGIGALAIPGLGPFIAAGPIMAALSGVGVGATVGGIAGALVGMGIPEIEAKRYEGRSRAATCSSRSTPSRPRSGRAQRTSSRPPGPTTSARSRRPASRGPRRRIRLTEEASAGGNGPGHARGFAGLRPVRVVAQPRSNAPTTGAPVASRRSEAWRGVEPGPTQKR